MIHDDYPEMLRPREAWGIIACVCIGWAIPVGIGLAAGYFIWG